jgi:hypothetical protein
VKKCSAKITPTKPTGIRATSKYRGVTHHCRTGRFESHIWDSGKQVYLGGFDTEEQAALAYDIAAVKCRGPAAITNFNIQEYRAELENLHSVCTCALVHCSSLPWAHVPYAAPMLKPGYTKVNLCKRVMKGNISSG